MLLVKQLRQGPDPDPYSHPDSHPNLGAPGRCGEPAAEARGALLLRAPRRRLAREHLLHAARRRRLAARRRVRAGGRAGGRIHVRAARGLLLPARGGRTQRQVGGWAAHGRQRGGGANSHARGHAARRGARGERQLVALICRAGAPPLPLRPSPPSVALRHPLLCRPRCDALCNACTLHVALV